MSEDLGSLFQQRRAQAAASGGNRGEGSKKKSFLEIQEEQKQRQETGGGRQQRGGGGQSPYRGGGGGRFAGGGSGHGSDSGAFKNFASRRGNSPKRDTGPRGGSGGRRGRGGNNRSNLPLEQGVICTLKDAFGFIHCADRPAEIFFHYSEVSGCHPDDLQIDDEVQFRVGFSNDRMAAYQVQRLEPGTIVWETEDEPGVRRRGLVERPVRFDRGGGRDSSNVDGTIRALTEAASEDAGGERAVTDKADGPLVLFSSRDYQPSSDQESSSPQRGSGRRQSNRLARGDLVEFSIITDRRTKEKRARSITLLLSERERARQEEERKLLATAKEEVGVVTALKGEYGFLQSSTRREAVYFHYSSIEMEGETEEGDFVLKEGQDLKFLVVGDGTKQKISARRVSLQPRGSVIFHETLAEGVTGVVVRCPQPIDSGHSLDERGKILLSKPLIDTNEDGTERVVTEVLLRSKASPGGTYGFRGETRVGLWIQPGDTLLFDVAKDFVDGTCHAVATRYLKPRKDDEESEDVIDADDDDAIPAVRLIDLCLAGRAEGVVNAVKDMVKDPYGFIHFAERPVDVHFKLFQVLPEELQKDLRRNMGIADVDNRGNPLELRVGTEAQFDISIHGNIQPGGALRDRKKQRERENMKAQRILFLPPKTITKSRTLASRARGTISKVDKGQAYSGAIDLDEEIMPVSMDERHPLVAKMIDKYLASDLKIPLKYHDIQSKKEDEVIIRMLETKGKGKLTWTQKPQEDEAEHGYAGRICIQKIDPEAETPVEHTAETEADGSETEKADVSGDASMAKDTDSDDADNANGSGDGSAPNASAKKKKKPPAPLKPLKTVRYDKASLSKKLKEDMPPTTGCIVEFDVIHSRRTGQLMVENMTMVERVAAPVNPTGTSGIGIVKEVVSARNFGFITVLDDDAAKLEMLFFDLANVVAEPNEDSAQKKPSIRKGAEVKFDIGTESNGKRVATNVTVLPEGAIPSKADKNACRGYVLLEPAHTTLKNTPNRSQSNSSQKSSEGGRWENVSDTPKKAEPSLTREEGCILLLEDPTGMFGEDALVTHVHYKNGGIAICGAGSSSAVDGSTNPRRGDMVTFTSGRVGSKNVRDVRIAQREAATAVRGTLDDIVQGADGTAKFVASTKGQEAYDVKLSEVVSCNPSVLKPKESVEGILYGGKIYGIARTADLHLGSKLGSGLKERPKLNLTVKKDRGGTIMAQSMMAKGPEGGKGFASGWTRRVSKYDLEQTPPESAPSQEVGATDAAVSGEPLEQTAAESTPAP